MRLPKEGMDVFERRNFVMATSDEEEIGEREHADD